MSRILLTSIFLSFFYFSGDAQNTFNKQYYFDGIAAIGNGIHVTDSCYYFSGLIVDTLPPYDEGIVFGKLNLNGDLVYFNTILDTNYTFQNWLTPLIYNADENMFISMGYGFDSIGNYNYWMKISPEGERIATRFFRNAYYPISPYTRMNDFLYHEELNQYFALNESNIGENELGLTPGYNTSVTRLSSQGDSLNSFTYEQSWSHLPTVIVSFNDQLIFGVRESNHNITSLNLKSISRIVAIDTAFQLQWSWISSNQVQQGANDMIAEPDGSLIIASGRGFLEYVNVATRAILWDRGLIFKLNAEQEVVWEAEFTEPSAAQWNKLGKLVKAPESSGYVAAGELIAWVSEDHASWLGWLVKVSLEGDSLWSRNLFYYEQPDSIEYEHHIHDLQATPDGGYFMSGYTLDRAAGATPPRQRAWFIKVDSEGCLIPGCGLVDTESPNEEGPALLIYPNPADQYLNIYLGDNGGQEWMFLIFDGLGRQLGRYEAPLGQTTYMVPVGNYPAGGYYLQVVDELGRRLKTYTWMKGN